MIKAIEAYNKVVNEIKKKKSLTYLRNRKKTDTVKVKQLIGIKSRTDVAELPSVKLAPRRYQKIRGSSQGC